MHVAVVLRCPSFGGRAVSVDARAAEAVPGVRRIAPIASGIAVIADDFWAAKQGREVLAVQWEAGPLAALNSAAIRTALAAAARDPGTPVRDDGQVDAAFAQAGRRLEAVYETPYLLAHAAMEPTNCTAHVRADGCDVWVRVHRIVCAVDCGLAVNPNAVAAQMEGAVAFGLSAALKGEITLPWPRAAGQLRRPSHSADGRNALGRGVHPTQPRAARRRGRTRRAARGAGSRQRRLRRHRPAHPPPAHPRRNPADDIVRRP
ncbi:MAG: molybdopterin cofactor-binding domain-containing protein [Pseudomonadota bacterium]